MSARPAVASDHAALERTWVVGAIKGSEAEMRERQRARSGENGDGKAGRSKEESTVFRVAI